MKVVVEVKSEDIREASPEEGLEVWHVCRNEKGKDPLIISCQTSLVSSLEEVSPDRMKMNYAEGATIDQQQGIAVIVTGAGAA